MCFLSPYWHLQQLLILSLFLNNLRVHPYYTFLALCESVCVCVHVCPLTDEEGEREGVRAKLGSQIEGLGHLFRRHIKPKKQHEIKRLGEVRKERERERERERDRKGEGERCITDLLRWYSSCVRG